MHKHDELCAVVGADNPDVICIVESWLSTEIHDTEIAICGYHSYRLDRNRHSGGIIVYVRSCFVTTLVSVPSRVLEIISLTVSNGIGKVCISVFYCPPSSPSLLFEDLFLYLQSLNIPEFCNYILLGILMLISVTILTLFIGSCSTFLIYHKLCLNPPTHVLMAVLL